MGTSNLVAASHQFWTGKIDGRHRYSTEEWRKKYATELLALLPHGGTLLDIGCGACELTTYIAPEFKKVYAIDFSQTMLAAARERVRSYKINNIELLQGMAQAFPQPVNRVNVILANGVIQYLSSSEIALCLRECRRVLTGGGVVCISMIPDVALKWTYYRTIMISGQPQTPIATLRRELRILRRRLTAFVKKDLLWDGIGNWFSREDIAEAAERSGFDCELRYSLYYDYRFHALLSPKAPGLSASI
jgi:ubiquinone/menaquinone biosynthesis C-methylase UbiE